VGTKLRHPVTATLTYFGGNRSDNAAAQVQAWQHVLALLDRNA
jgi:hypothetical protein